MIAQRVSAGFRLPMNTQPQRGDRTPAPATATFGRFSSAGHRLGTPDIFACPSCPKLIFTPRRRDRRGWNTPSSPVSSLRTASMLKHETKAQESGNKLAAIHRLLPVSGPVDRPIHPDHSKWNCPSNAMAGCSRPATDFYGNLPLTRHGHRCPLHMIDRRRRFN
jgi:hypothetical protein